MTTAAERNVVELRPGRYSQTHKPGTPNPVWDACELALGYGPATTSEKALWGKMVHSLVLADATPERIGSVASWYRRHWEVDLTITALEKWYSHFLSMALKRETNKGNVCAECGVGGGLHAADCAAAR